MMEDKDPILVIRFAVIQEKKKVLVLPHFGCTTGMVRKYIFETINFFRYFDI